MIEFRSLVENPIVFQRFNNGLPVYNDYKFIKRYITNKPINLRQFPQNYNDTLKLHQMKPVLDKADKTPLYKDIEYKKSTWKSALEQFTNHSSNE